MELRKDNAMQMFMYYSKNTIKSWFQYKLDACVRSLAVFLREATGIIVIYLTLLTFGSIGGWDTYELLFLFSFVYLTYGILILFFTGFRDFEHTVNSGNFDRLILRPRGLLFQVLASDSDWFACLGHGGLGIVVFIFSVSHLNIEWSTWKIIYCIMSVFNGVLIQGAIFLFTATLSFYFIKTSNMRELMYWQMRKFAGYPISIFPKVIQFLMTYIVPFAFVNYFPASYLLGKDISNKYNNAYLWAVPFIGMILYALVYLFWRYSLRHYKSSGN